MTTTLLLDADIVAYQLAATAQRGYKFPGMDTPAVALDDWDDQPARIDAVVSDLCKGLKTSEVIVCLSCPTSENFRLDFLPTYKGNRKDTIKPEFLGAVKDYLEGAYPSYRRPRLEADDIMGILSTHPSLVKGRKIIVSEDKDMKTIPGWLFNPAKDKKPRLIEQEEADYWHLYQTLIGDPTDGYSGCPGIGPKKAEKVLANWSSYSDPTVWAAVVSTFESRGLTEADALTQARAARILRATDYDFKNKEVIPWNPPAPTLPLAGRTA